MEKELSKAALAEYSYKRGREDERNEIAGFLNPETIEITIRARGPSPDNELNALRQVLTFDEFKHSEGEVFRYMVDEAGVKFAAESKILQAILAPKEKETPPSKGAA